MQGLLENILLQIIGLLLGILFWEQDWCLFSAGQLLQQIVSHQLYNAFLAAYMVKEYFVFFEVYYIVPQSKNVCFPSGWNFKLNWERFSFCKIFRRLILGFVSLTYMFERVCCNHQNQYKARHTGVWFIFLGFLLKEERALSEEKSM